MSTSALYAHLLGRLWRPIAAYLDDASVTEVLINGPDQVFVECEGRLRRVDVSFAPDILMASITAVAASTGRHVDAINPVLEARLPDGSRFQAVVPPAVRGGPCIAIRRFAGEPLTLAKLVQLGALDAQTLAILRRQIGERRNLLVVGGTGSGKTSLLNALSALVPADERVVVIEDAAELALQLPHVVSLEAVPPDAKGRGRVSIGDLFRASLRLRPDRIVIGELRGGEALDLIQAMSSGHGGCMSTLHASHPLDALRRLETMAAMADTPLPLSALRAQIASAVDVIVQVGRLRDGRRRVTHVVEVGPADDGYAVHTLFERSTRGNEHG